MKKTYDVRCFFGIFDLSTYPNQISTGPFKYYVSMFLAFLSLFSKIRCSLTYLSTYLKIWRHMWMLPCQKWFSGIDENIGLGEQHVCWHFLINSIFEPHKFVKMGPIFFTSSLKVSKSQIKHFLFSIVPKKWTQR